MFIKKYLIIMFLTLLLLVACSDKNDENRPPSTQKKIIDSLTIVKENEAVKTKKLRHELDSLKKHLDSLKAISSDSTHRP
ncbi:MAG: hypothetical protein GXO85_16475 [Chlorobi bacterium]|nr:hypothetical protein [Chlorobiota bacterium]